MHEPRFQRVSLVFADMSDRYKDIDDTFGVLPPGSSLSILACETERRLDRARVAIPLIRIFDRPPFSDDTLAELARDELIGFGTWFSNYEAALQIAQRLKERNPDCRIVFGGPDSGNLNARILRSRPFVDWVVEGDGEDTLWRLIAGESEETTPNLWYRVSGRPCFTFAREVSLDTTGLFDFRHVMNVDLRQYDSRRAGYSYDPARLPIAVSLTRGCPIAASSRRCSYCSIPGTTVRTMAPNQAWTQVRHLHERYGIDSFFEAGDDITLDQYAEELANSDDRLDDMHFRAYSGLWKLQPKKVAALASIGVSELFCGVETTDRSINKWSGHPVTHKLIERALTTLREFGILATIPFLFGLPGECRENLDTMEHLAYELVEKYKNIRMVLVSIGMPLIGSSWFEQIRSDPLLRLEYGEGSLDDIDVPNYARLTELSMKRFSAVSPEDVVETAQRMRGNLQERVIVGCFGALDPEIAAAQSNAMLLKA